ncbi:BTB/POZ domain-containing protein 3/6 [Mytilus galloprovincialis]|uniref:BTB/POZ domain-containing protein 3/6 n=1 Tax=Mytilus galloprovincialis TaxID=29158 RepID=A0A8B6FXA3_MYTGA|nr:BTB/POZ domain-containing protein 3/6 [Mytilus galloprovincialis]
MDTITGKLSQICLTEDMADVFFSFKGENIARIPAHKMILALGSPVFKAMFYGSFPQSEGDIRIEDITLETFQTLVRYMYTDHLLLSKKNVISLLYAAQKYQIAGLISKCENYLQDNLAVNNACTIFSNTKFFTMDTLQTNALKFIADNAIEVLKSEDFLLLPSENIVYILELDSLRVQEVDVIRDVLRWVDHQLTKSKIKVDGKSRRSVLLKDSILFTLAIPLLSIEEFTSIVIPCGILTDEEQLLIFKAITMSNSPLSCGKFRIHPRDGTKLPMYAQKIRLPNRRGYETEEGTVTMDVIFDGKACKLPIDKIIPQNEMLVMTIKPNVTNFSFGMWGQNQHATKTFPISNQNWINDMMYQHKLSDQTTLYLSLTGGHLVESFELLEFY